MRMPVGRERSEQRGDDGDVINNRVGDDIDIDDVVVGRIVHESATVVLFA